MSIKLIQGDLLKQLDVDVIVNTVNCVGVMGKGIALQFKKKWPENYKLYAKACKDKQVSIGKMFVYDAGALATPKYIINFPTKDHWRGNSKVEYITTGLVDLIHQIKELQIKSIAIPPLGCGNGGLEWDVVKDLIYKAFEEIPNVEVYLFEPSGTPAAKTMEVRTSRPRMTAGRAALLKALETYRSLNYGLSKLEVQKLAYFLQEAGEDLKLQFVQHTYGPYAESLRHALDRMDGHFIFGLGDGVVESEIAPSESALQEANEFIRQSGNEDLLERINRLASLIEGYQSLYGMELLSTVHWVVSQHGAKNKDAAIEAVHQWSGRKKNLMKPEHIAVAWNHLEAENWICAV